MDSTYSHSETCSNCGVLQRFSIPKGTRVLDFMQDKLCKNCGCSMRGSLRLNKPTDWMAEPKQYDREAIGGDTILKGV